MSTLPVSPPPLQVSQWFNTRAALSLDDFRGRVVVIEAFQMLCPGCVSHALPQAARIHALFPRDQVAVIGLHTVFEHHAAMNPEALAAFLHEYRIEFPVGVDAASSDDRIPQTMRAWQLEGTPSLVLIDRAGQMRLKNFGRLDDMRVGAEVMALVGEPLPSPARGSDDPAAARCDADGCALP